MCEALDGRRHLVRVGKVGMRHAQHNRMVNQKTSRPISLEMRSSLQRLVCEVGQRCLAREARLGDIALLNAIAGMTVAESTYDKLQLFLNNWQANPEKRTMSDKGWLCQRCGASNAPWLPTCQCKPPVDQQPVKTAPVAQGVSTTSDKIVWGQQ